MFWRLGVTVSESVCMYKHLLCSRTVLDAGDMAEDKMERVPASKELGRDRQQTIPPPSRGGMCSVNSLERSLWLLCGTQVLPGVGSKVKVTI